MKLEEPLKSGAKQRIGLYCSECYETGSLLERQFMKAKCLSNNLLHTVMKRKDPSFAEGSIRLDIISKGVLSSR